MTEPVSIEAAIRQGIARFDQFDALISNAGYRAYGPHEAFSMARIQRQFDSNVIGLLATTRALLPHFRTRRSGSIVNISPIGGQMTFPLGSLNHGTKFAVEGLFEALHYVLEAFGVKVKIVEPGMVRADFGGRPFDFCNAESMSKCQDTVQKLFALWGGSGENTSAPEVVGEVIWQAVNDGSNPLRYRAGADAVELLD